MAESVKEVAPETRPRGQRRGLDRLRASGEGQGSQAVPARTAVPDAAPAAPQTEAAVSSAPVDTLDVRTHDVVVEPAPVEPAVVPADAQDTETTGDSTTLVATEPGDKKPLETDDASTAQPEGGRPSRVLVAVIAVLALLVAFLGYRFWDTHSSARADKRHYEQLNAVDGRNQAVLSAGRQASVTLLTYDYRHLDKDFAAVLNGSTGGFKKDFASRQATAKSLFAQGKAIASGQVLDAAVVSSTSTSATALVVIDQSVKNVSVPNGTTKHYRMQLKLTKVGSSWLVSDVEFPA
jgi:Mce-associated membrane protein